MIKARFYLPQNNNKNPVVIGLPGFLHEDEKSRVDYILEDLCKRSNIAGIRITFPDISSSQDGKLITCDFNLERYVDALVRATEFARSQREFEISKIGVIGSSVSAGVLGHYLSSHSQDNPFVSCVIISPLPSWQDFSTPYMRERILSSNRGLPLTTDRDRKKGIVRVIPQEYLEEAKKLDSLLREKPLKGMNVLTLIGKNDQTVSHESMREYHHLIGGDSNGIREYDTGHDIPLEETLKETVSFLSSTLR